MTDRVALVDPNDQIVRIEPAAKINKNVSTKPGWKWLDYVVEPVPTFNSATQALTDPVTTVGETSVTVSRSVRDLTAQELADNATAGKDSQISRLVKANRVVLEAIFILANDVRALQGKGAITKQQYLTALRGLL